MTEKEKSELPPQLIFNIVLKKMQRKNISFILKQHHIEPRQMQAWENMLLSHGPKIYEKTEEEEKAKELASKGDLIIKKVKKGHDGHHAGAWKVAYADFVTAMMAFFLLMWLVTMTEEVKKIGIADYFEKYSLLEDYGVTEKSGKIHQTEVGRLQKNEVKEDPYKRMTDALQKEIKAQFGSKSDQVQMEFTSDGFRIQLVDKFDAPMFDSGSNKLKSWPKELIGIVSRTIIDIPVKLGIEGYTDSVPFNAKGITNWELSALRAAAARSEFEKNGIPASRFAKIVGYAHTRPLIPDDPTSPKNRRIAITLFP